MINYVEVLLYRLWKSPIEIPIQTAATNARALADSPPTVGIRTTAEILGCGSILRARGSEIIGDQLPCTESLYSIMTS